MSRQQRFVLLAAAAAIAVGAFLVLRPDDDDDEPASPARTTAPADTVETRPEPRPEPEATRIGVRGAEPVGGVREIEAEKGDTVRITVSSDTPQEVHLHGYDLTHDAAPGSPARFRFEADIEGVFEIELEGPKVPIAELRVEP